VRVRVRARARCKVSEEFSADMHHDFRAKRDVRSIRFFPVTSYIYSEFCISNRLHSFHEQRKLNEITLTTYLGYIDLFFTYSSSEEYLTDAVRIWVEGESKWPLARKAENLTAFCEPIV
jgi:hypothetical protein